MRDCRTTRSLRFVTAALLAAALQTTTNAAGQKIAANYAEASRVARFENASRLSVGVSGLYVVDRGANQVTRVVPRTRAGRAGGGGGDPDGPSNPVDVDASAGLTFLIADQSGTVHRYSRDFAALEALRILPERQSDLASIASIDERTIFGIAGDGSLFRWTRERGSIRVDVGTGAGTATGARDAASPRAYAQVVADARNVFVLARDDPRVYVLDAFGGHVRSINVEANAEILSMTVSADVLWLLRRQATTSPTDDDSASIMLDGFDAEGVLLATVVLTGFKEPIVGAAGVGGNLWVLTSEGLYVFDD